ncbi:hypothetical protein OHC33_004379 [Knufia fluminis]|uniref:Uncharacterized protein n=1 Tax=Knufia fluminis TaxID=191047 RepID=A0AAN8EIA8_9EURO|nr:hypothetical protein OHC33_004379 [Knufia fluminis]
MSSAMSRSVNTSYIHKLPAELRLLVWEYVFSSSKATIVQLPDRRAFCFSTGCTATDEPPKHYPHPLYYIFPEFRGELADHFYQNILVTKYYSHPFKRWCEVPYQMTDKVQRLSLDARELTSNHRWLFIDWPDRVVDLNRLSDVKHLLRLEDFPYLEDLEIRWEPEDLMNMDIRWFPPGNEHRIRLVLVAMIFLPKAFRLLIHICVLEPVQVTEPVPHEVVMEILPDGAIDASIVRPYGPREEILRATVSDHALTCEQMRDSERTLTCLMKAREGLCLNGPRSEHEDALLRAVLAVVPLF